MKSKNNDETTPLIEVEQAIQMHQQKQENRVAKHRQTVTAAHQQHHDKEEMDCAQSLLHGDGWDVLHISHARGFTPAAVRHHAEREL